MEPHETRIRVRYAETDQMGVVHHANYLVWMEVARVELCRSRGFDYRQMERDCGVYLAVAEATCRYVSAARFDDEVIIRVWVEQAGSRMVLFGYEIRDALDGRRVARAQTRHVFLDRELKPCRVPGEYRPLFGLS